ncbi:hypothetical protein KAR91_15270 [Candidatus Pacearchaeota archaeon]|nr:hypothetical protein [Candidatus Pacearchaeota archaeon]
MRKIAQVPNWGAWKDVAEINEKRAAVKAVEIKEWDDVNFLVGSGQGESEVEVKIENSNEPVKTFIVTGESRPTYTAKEINNADRD